MSEHEDLVELSLEDLQTRCLEETGHYYQQGSSDWCFCYEIFRRAIVEGSGEAWEKIINLYQRQVVHWVRRHPSFVRCKEDEFYFTNRALEKMWVAISAEKFTRFPELKHLLRYLQMCVHSVIMDYLRATDREKIEVGAGLMQSHEDGILLDPVDDTYLMNGYQECWHMVERHITSRKEKIVAVESFTLNFKPGEIYKRHLKVFKDINEVYKIKETLLSRLRTDLKLIEIAGLNREKLGNIR